MARLRLGKKQQILFSSKKEESLVLLTSRLEGGREAFRNCPLLSRQEPQRATACPVTTERIKIAARPAASSRQGLWSSIDHSSNQVRAMINRFARPGGFLLHSLPPSTRGPRDYNWPRYFLRKPGHRLWILRLFCPQPTGICTQIKVSLEPLPLYSHHRKRSIPTRIRSSK